MISFAERAERELAARTRTLPFDSAEYGARQARLRARMAAAGMDALVVMAPEMMCWLHGYDARWYRAHSSTALPPLHATVVHLDRDEVVLVEIAEHAELVRLTSCVDRARLLGGEPTLPEFAAAVAAELGGPGVVGVERWSSVPSPAVCAAVEEAVGGRFADATQVLRGARLVKSAAELAMIERAQAACDAGVRALQREARPGMSELAAWATYVTGVIEAGGEPAAIHETIASGPPMPMLHGMSTRAPLGQWFHADVAAAVHRYHARATRPLAFGGADPELARLVEIAAGAQDVVLATARVGVAFAEIGEAVRAYFREAGVEGWAGGYELGLSFPPDWVGEFVWGSVDSGAQQVVEAGMVTNLEAEVFTALVDTIVFEEGGPRLLSSLPRTTLVVET